MTETTPFFESLLFWIPFSFIIGAIFGFVITALLASSGQASRDEERWENEAHKKQSQAEKLVKKYGEIFTVTQGKPDRE